MGSPFGHRFTRVRAAMVDDGVDALLLSVGADLPWLCGYEAMPLERLTMLVVPVDAEATLVVPELEAPRVREQGDLFVVRPWGETEDPVAIVADMLRGATRAGVGDRTWARFLLELSAAAPGTRFERAAPVTAPLRAVKDAHELAVLERAASAADRVAGQLQRGEVPLLGRSEAQISADLGRRLVGEGHRRVNFAIVAAGPDAASAHHEPGGRVVAAGDVVLCDFGGTMLDEHGVGYCSDITRCVAVGAVSDDVADAHRALELAQEVGVLAAKVGTPAADVDAAARYVLAEHGFGDRFVHRTGHGIGVEEHEDPYLVAGNAQPLQEGNVFSVEPGIYTPGGWGLRLEDIVVATADGPRRLNVAERALAVVEA